MSPRPLRLACASLLVALVCGCSTLPDSGVVHTRRAKDTSQLPYFTPSGPTKDDSPAGIVRGFLLAMQANPPSTAVARSFLSSRAKDTWTPTKGTIVYDAPTLTSAVDVVTAQLRGAFRLSPSGAWLDGTDGTTRTLPLTLVQEGGQWRIDNPPNALAVPTSYFDSLFVGYNLYYFDRTGTVLVPTRVYLPRGEQTATNLVRGLLAGPPRAQRDVAVSALPPKLDLDGLAVVVNDVGIADVPLGRAVLSLPPAELNRMVVQLAWTLRQVPGITRLRLSVDGSPVPLSGGRTDVSVSIGPEYDPVTSPQRELLAISGGRVLRDDGETAVPVAGPFGQPGFALRSLAWSTREHAIAAVSASGRRVFVAPDEGGHSAARVRAVLDGGRDVLRPAYDRFGGLWFVDDSAEGAVVHLFARNRDRIVHVGGVSGRPVSAFTVTRDGSALVAVLANGANPTVEVSSLVRGASGRLREALGARTLQVSGADLGPARDVAQIDATTVAVLTRPAGAADQVVYVELDGSPAPEGVPGSGPPKAVPGALAGLVARPDPALALRVVTADRRVFALAEGSQWLRDPLTNVVAASYAE
ncbi:hypothetical protein ACVW00_001191 [Marmoricola sp. URHA0025 HA25]